MEQRQGDEAYDLALSGAECVGSLKACVAWCSQTFRPCDSARRMATIKSGRTHGPGTLELRSAGGANTVGVGGTTRVPQFAAVPVVMGLVSVIRAGSTCHAAQVWRTDDGAADAGPSVGEREQRRCRCGWVRIAQHFFIEQGVLLQNRCGGQPRHDTGSFCPPGETSNSHHS